jgi:hypothetical protein
MAMLMSDNLLLAYITLFCEQQQCFVSCSTPTAPSARRDWCLLQLSSSADGGLRLRCRDHSSTIKASQQQLQLSPDGIRVTSRRSPTPPLPCRCCCHHCVAGGTQPPAPRQTHRAWLVPPRCRGRRRRRTVAVAPTDSACLSRPASGAQRGPPAWPPTKTFLRSWSSPRPRQAGQAPRPHGVLRRPRSPGRRQPDPRHGGMATARTPAVAGLWRRQRRRNLKCQRGRRATLRTARAGPGMGGGRAPAMASEGLVAILGRMLWVSVAEILRRGGFRSRQSCCCPACRALPHADSERSPPIALRRLCCRYRRCCRYQNRRCRRCRGGFGGDCGCGKAPWPCPPEARLRPRLQCAAPRPRPPAAGSGRPGPPALPPPPPWPLPP